MFKGQDSTHMTFDIWKLHIQAQFDSITANGEDMVYLEDDFILPF